jgi:hypothetical protein
MDHIEIVKRMVAAYEAADREAAERIIGDPFAFSAPPDPHLDRAGYWERCWPGAGRGTRMDPVRLVEIGDDEVLMTYEATRADGTRFRNSEIYGFDGDRIARIEVYFGWDL